VKVWKRELEIYLTLEHRFYSYILCLGAAGYVEL
jgi:hypothetical protein